MSRDDINKIIAALVADDKKAQAILRKIADGEADFSDTAKYSEIISNILGSVVSENVEEIEDVEEVVTELLREHYEEINGVLGDVQNGLDRRNGLKIKPQKAEFPEERVQQFVHSLVDPTVDSSVIRRRAENGTANIAMSLHDDYMETNAKFRSKSGLLCYIVRKTDGKCCEWCSKIAGRYLYGMEPHDVYRRHDNCGCTCIYENGRERQDVWSKTIQQRGQSNIQFEEQSRRLSKERDVENKEKRLRKARQYKPEKLSKDKAKALQDEKIARFNGVDKSGENGIIKEKENIYQSVTDEAINNVPLVKPQGFSDEEAVALQEAHKQLLEEVKKYPVGTECALVLDSALNPIEDVIVGNESANVHLSQYDSMYMVLHNHPSGQTFGITDMFSFADSIYMFAMSVVGNNGSVFILNKSANFDNKGFTEYLFNLKNKKLFNGFSYEQLKNSDEYIETLSKPDKERLKHEIFRLSKEAFEGGKKYGVIYTEKSAIN